VTSPGALLIRAGADSQRGAGHLMRCLALAQAWREARAGPVTVLGQVEQTGLRDRLAAEGCDLLEQTDAWGSPSDAAATLAAARRLGAEWVVADDYAFDAEFLRALSAGAHVLAIDDEGRLPDYPVALLLNQNPHARAELYPRCAGRRLLGLSYALLRREFLERGRPAPAPAPDQARRLLVTLGGADPRGVTLQVLDALRDAAGPLEVRAVIGLETPALRAAVEGHPHGVQLLTQVRDMRPHMEWADLAVCAGGSTNWELCFLGVPRLLIVLADNQVPLARALEQLGCARDLGWYDQLDRLALVEALSAIRAAPQLRASMAQRGRELVDGGGAARVVEAMLGS
jgi:UDP-2,4-diacetamido-2,4,6-trideoxy-beta-L-altropyranose hydrolase